MTVEERFERTPLVMPTDWGMADFNLCLTCGAVVRNPELHNDWHNRQDEKLRGLPVTVWDGNTFIANF